MTMKKAKMIQIKQKEKKGKLRKKMVLIESLLEKMPKKESHQRKEEELEEKEVEIIKLEL